MNISVMNSKDNWNIFSKNRNAIYGVAIISIMIFHFFEDIANSNLSGGGLGFLGKLYNTFIGSVGVEFFVFLSGVGLYFSMSKDSNILHFFQKRIKRILPAYLMVAIPYWIVIDLIIMQKGVKMFAFDFGFVTFFTQGTRTFWYVLFIVFAYLIYPFVYKILEQFGKMSYELYLTHVAIRALMNVIGIKTFYFQNYVFCILISLFLTYTIVKLQKKLI